jgi:hypothetical protein
MLQIPYFLVFFRIKVRNTQIQLFTLFRGIHYCSCLTFKFSRRDVLYIQKVDLFFYEKPILPSTFSLLIVPLHWHCMQLQVMTEWNKREFLPILEYSTSLYPEALLLSESKAQVLRYSIPSPTHPHTHWLPDPIVRNVIFQERFSGHFIPCRIPHPFSLPQLFPFSRHVMKILHRSG